MNTEMEQNALNLIEKQLEKSEKPVVACSFGKDSMVVLYLTAWASHKIDKDFDVLWNNTGVAYPDVIRFKKKIENDWDLNVIETPREKEYWDILEEHGFPGVVSSDRKDTANSSCCYWLKKKPTKKAIDKHNWDMYFDGLTAFESDRRFMNIKEYGLVHDHQTFGLTKVHPIAWWDVNDVWNYIEANNIPYPDIYDREFKNYNKRGEEIEICGHKAFKNCIRVGCWSCTLALKHEPGKMKQLRVYYRKLWKFLMQDKGLSQAIVEEKEGDQLNIFAGDNSTEDWLKSQPCFFDQL